MKMKIFYTLVLLSIFSSGLIGQYNFTVSSSPYENLTNSISLNEDQTWDDPTFIIPIGFDFEYYGKTVNELNTVSSLGATLFSEISAENIANVLIPYGADLIDRGYDFETGEVNSGSLSPVSYLLEGNVGNRILKIEWKNAGFYSEFEIDDISSDFTNFQVWLYESSNDIEIHFGPTSINNFEESFDEESGPYVAMFPDYNLSTDELLGEGIVVYGDPSNPSQIYVDQFVDLYLEGVAAEGTVYKFSLTDTGSNDITSNHNDIYICPNPATNYINFTNNSDAEITHISILNINGQKIIEEEYNQDAVDISSLTPGVYNILLHSSEGVYLERMIKK